MTPMARTGTLCSYCGIVVQQASRCNSCCSLVCKMCMAAGDECCLSCQQAFPTTPASHCQLQYLAPEFQVILHEFLNGCVGAGNQWPQLIPEQAGCAPALATQPSLDMLPWPTKQVAVHVVEPTLVVQEVPSSTTSHSYANELNTCSTPSTEYCSSSSSHTDGSLEPGKPQERRVKLSVPEILRNSSVVKSDSTPTLFSGIDKMASQIALSKSASKNLVQKRKTSLPTTMMLRNLPGRLNLKELVAAIDLMGYADAYQFIHLPTRCCRSNLGYAFVDFWTPEESAKFATKFEGYQFPGKMSAKMCTVTVADHQGFNASLRLQRNLELRAKRIDKA